MMATRIFYAAAVAASTVAVIALAALGAITVIDVGGRYLLNRPLLGAVEMSEFLMVFLSFGALALAELRNSHITVDFFVRALPERAQALLEVVVALIGIAFWSFVAWRAAVQSMRLFNNGEVTANLQLPTWPFYIAVVAGCGLLAVALTGRVWRNLRIGFG
jgi:TRAP-type C4-dicarboxylate transport system permease small subunit